MTSQATSNNQEANQEAKISDKELNFRKQEEMFQRKIEQEKAEKIQMQKRIEELERIAQEKIRSSGVEQDDDDDDEPYVDKRKLKKELNQFGQIAKKETESVVQQAVQRALAEERRNQWLKNNPDFYEVMNHAQKFAEKDPELAETILEMPDGFERQKLVYKNIKALGLHKKEEPKPSMQEQIDKNRRSPFYQPSNIGAPPYAAAGDFSDSGQKNSYAKMKELQARLRI